MIVADELRGIPIFACLEEADLQRFAARAADVRLEEGEWLIREGEMACFFVLLDGQMQLLKDILGKPMELYVYKPGEFFGEVPILLGAPALVSIQAKSRGRVARFDAQQLFDLIQNSAACSALILQTMTDRLMSVQRFVKETPSSRVLLVGTQYDSDCREIGHFFRLTGFRTSGWTRSRNRSGCRLAWRADTTDHRW
jgi:thioredoxin reductase (NADPH)